MALDAPTWLDLAYRLRSKHIFKEALIFGAGRFNTKEVQTAIKVQRMHPDVVATLEHKAGEVKKFAQLVETSLLSYYPKNMLRNRTVGRADRDSIGRSSYANDIMSWIALTVWRHWIAQTICNDKGHMDEDMGYALFDCINKAGEHYLGRGVLEAFHGYFPMSQKGSAVLENRVNELKKHAAETVKKILINESSLDTSRYSYEYILSAKILLSDYPWEKPLIYTVDGDVSVQPQTIDDNEDENVQMEDEQTTAHGDDSL